MLKRHRRFLAALAFGLLAAAAVPAGGAVPRALVGVDLFCAAYLLLMAHFARGLTPDELRRHSGEADEGVAAILLLGIAVVALSLALVFGVVASGAWRAGELALAIAGLPLSWAMLQTLFALHYARLFHAGPSAAGGLRFEATPEPGIWDFLYFSFTVGMTAQVSDTVVTNGAMRRMVLGHAVLSFFFNAVILALAVNAAATAAR
ncbi:MAG: DUF1345 domain-containing protein [Paracoccaceae bacterium]